MLDKRIFKFSGARQVLVWLTLLAGIQGFAIIGQGRFLSRTIVALWQGKPFATITNLIIIFALAYVVRQLMTVAKEYVLTPFADRVTQQLQQALLTKYTTLGPQVIASEGTGKSVTLLLEGLTKVHDYISLVLIKTVDMMVIPWIILAYLYTIHWEQATFLLFIYPVIVLFMIILGLAAQGKADREYETFNQLSNHFIDSMRGLTTLKQLGLSKKYADNIFEVSEQHRVAVVNTLKIAILTTFALDFFTTLSIAIVAVFLGLSLLDGQISFLPALTMLVLAPEYFLPIRNFANDYHATLNGKNSLADILNLLDQTTIAPTSQIALPAGWQQQDQLTLQDVNFTYGNAAHATLADINLSVKGYQKVALIGESGSGKSTLLNLLGGFNVGSGSIQINQAPVADLRDQGWQSNVMTLPQKPYIFHATLRDNLCFYSQTATDDQLVQALQTVGLMTWFEQLPSRLDTIIGEGALQVSGGQAQRLGLARILLDDQRRILLLDEPTAHLDIETEALLKEKMLPLFEHKLVFFATHRLHWLKQMDWIVVMRQGKIVEQGTLSDLYTNDSYFVELEKAMRGVTDAKS
ncbi:thiol reductant ABC exporter subunit CydD [Weissella soli]|uniref:thiol reductant ABC exporter subunit CydD n=1 Tax=Weissella soli TaxID=155866 RepID=UPI0035A1C940